jgi:ABC-type Fe3+-siderophore transport system permease subunit
MPNYRDLLSVQIIFGAVFTLLAGIIAVNITTFLQWNQVTVNALLFAFIAMYLLKDGVPNLILGLQEYFKGQNKEL